MQVNAPSPTNNFGFAVAKKAMDVNEEMGKQALSLIQDAATPGAATGPGNAPQQTTGVHLVA